MRLSELFESLNENGTWETYIFKRGPRADAFKRFLWDNDIYFEPAADGDYVHFNLLIRDLDKSAAVYEYSEYLKTQEDTIEESADSDLLSMLNQAALDAISSWDKDEDNYGIEIQAKDFSDDKGYGTEYTLYTKLEYYDTKKIADELNELLNSFEYHAEFYPERANVWKARVYKEVY